MTAIHVSRCPFVPERYKRAKCYKGCPQWNKKHKVCRLDVQARVSDAVEGRHAQDE